MTRPLLASLAFSGLSALCTLCASREISWAGVWDASDSFMTLGAFALAGATFSVGLTIVRLARRF